MNEQLNYCSKPIYNACVQPDHMFVLTQYFLNYWLPRLGPSSAWLLINLRQWAGYKKERGECYLSQQQLADELGWATYKTTKKYLRKGYMPWFVEVGKPRYWFSKTEGVPRRQATNYTVIGRDLVAPSHQNGLAGCLFGIHDQKALNKALCGLSEMEPEELRAYLERVSPPAGFEPLSAGTVSAVIESVTKIQMAPSGKTHARAKELMHNIITYPNKGNFVGTQYFRQKWQPILGERLAMLIVLLRNMCFCEWDTTKPVELRNECQCKKQWLADRLHFTRTFDMTRSRLSMRHPLASTFLESLSVVDGGDHDIRFHVQMWQNGGEPLVPEDKSYIEAAGDRFDLSVFSRSLRGRQSQRSDAQNQQGICASAADSDARICSYEGGPEQRICSYEGEPEQRIYSYEGGQNNGFIPNIQRPTSTKTPLTKTDNLDEDYNAGTGDNDKASPSSSDPLSLWQKRIRECERPKQRAGILAEMYRSHTGYDASTDLMVAAMKRAGGHHKATKVADAIASLNSVESAASSMERWLCQLPAIESAFARIGIVGKNRIEIASSDWVTSEYITGWADWYEAQGGQDKKITPGYIVRCVKNGSPVPKIPSATIEPADNGDGISAGDIDPVFAYVTKCYEQEVGKLTPAIVSQITDAVSPEGDNLCDEDTWKKAFERSASLRKLSWAYIRKVALGVAEDKKMYEGGASKKTAFFAELAEQAAEEAAEKERQKADSKPPDIWDETKAFLARTLHRPLFTEYLKQTKLLSSSIDPDGLHGEFTIGISEASHMEWMLRMKSPICRALAMITECLSSKVYVEFVLIEQNPPDTATL